MAAHRPASRPALDGQPLSGGQTLSAEPCIRTLQAAPPIPRAPGAAIVASIQGALFASSVGWQAPAAVGAAAAGLASWCAACWGWRLLRARRPQAACAFVAGVVSERIGPSIFVRAYARRQPSIHWAGVRVPPACSLGGRQPSCSLVPPAAHSKCAHSKSGAHVIYGSCKGRPTAEGAPLRPRDAGAVFRRTGATVL